MQIVPRGMTSVAPLLYVVGQGVRNVLTRRIEELPNMQYRQHVYDFVAPKR